MIGGCDVVIPTKRNESDALARSIETIKKSWPKLVKEECGKEILVYKDQVSLDSWTIDGAMPENKNTMIHLLYRDNELTVVVDDLKDSVVNDIIKDIRQSLRV